MFSLNPNLGNADRAFRAIAAVALPDQAASVAKVERPPGLPGQFNGNETQEARMLSFNTYRRIFLASAWYDLAVTAVFATPWTLALLYALFATIHSALGLSPLQSLPPEGVLYANFFGSVVIVWATLRLRSGLVWLARYDAAARFMFSAAMIHALTSGASPLLWGFLVIELTFGILQLLPYKRTALQTPT